MNLAPGVAIETEQNRGYRANSRSEVLPLVPVLEAGARVLEIGCGEGLFCTQIRGNPELWGIEPDARAAEAAKARLHTVLTGTFEERKPELPSNYFDLVVCNDVIEHMTDHDLFLSQIQTYMKPGGYLIGSLPNVRFYVNLFNLLIARDWHYQDSGILDRTHFRFFTFRSVRRSLEAAGFEVRRLQGLNEAGWSRRSLRSIAERCFRNVLIAGSLGTSRDIKYLQVGFQAMVPYPGGAGRR